LNFGKAAVLVYMIAYNIHYMKMDIGLKYALLHNI
jgi:hypothetical protein